jgi:hypothetical protein
VRNAGFSRIDTPEDGVVRAEKQHPGADQAAGAG